MINLKVGSGGGMPIRRAGAVVELDRDKQASSVEYSVNREFGS